MDEINFKVEISVVKPYSQFDVVCRTVITCLQNVQKQSKRFYLISNVCDNKCKTNLYILELFV